MYSDVDKHLVLAAVMNISKFDFKTPVLMLDVIQLFFEKRIIIDQLSLLLFQVVDHSLQFFVVFAHVGTVIAITSNQRLQMLYFPILLELEFSFTSSVL